MRKLTLSYLIFLSYLLTAQNFTKGTDPYIASNGEVFNVGDIILIGTPADFSNDYQYYTQSADLSIKKSATGTVTIGEYTSTYDNRYDRETIKYFYIDSVLGTFAVTDKLFKVMINIEKGLESGELVSKKHFKSLVNSSTYLTDSVAYLRMLNGLGNVSIENTKEFTYLFENQKYRKIREDEFEFENQISLQKKKLEKITLDTSFTDTLKIKLKIELGNYDFENKGFPVLWENKDGLQILNDMWEFLTPVDINKQGINLTDLRLKLLNTEKFDFLSLDKQKANYFVKHRKSVSGDVDRWVYIYAHILIQDVEKVNKSKFDYDFLNGEIRLDCELIKICFFEDTEGYNWLNNID